jgi:phosphatidate cytidylyltransferase
MIALALGACWLDAWLDGVASPIGTGTLPPGVVLTPVVVAVAVLAALELKALLVATGIPASRVMTIGTAVLGIAVSALVPTWEDGVTGAAIVSFAVGTVLVASMVFYGADKRVEGMVAAAGGALLSFCILGLMLGFIVTLRREHEVWIVLWVLLVTKFSDIGAYTVGSLIGRHKLIPWISPGKTWEGLGGAVVVASLLGLGGAELLRASGVEGVPDRVPATLMGGVFALIGQVGDLIASVLKRDAGAKDSGSSIPGFGGVLDVVDSLLLSLPVAYWLLPVAAG